jgi:ABC-type glycerol-3-phosphate transport system permease component
MWKDVLRKIKNKMNLEKRTVGERIIFTVVFFLFALEAFSIFYAFAWGLSASLKGPLEYYDNTFGLPKGWLFSNYLDSFSLIELDGIGYVDMLVNSIWYTFGGVFIYLATQGLVCYILAKYTEFKLVTIMTNIGIVLMMIPIYGTLPATYKLYMDIGIFDTPFLLIDCISLFGANWLIMLSYYRNISAEYRDAAFLDGCGHFQAYVRIMLPLASPILISCGLLSFMGRWTDYQTPILFLESYPTLSSGLYTFGEYAERFGNYPMYFAGLFVSSLPLVLLFIVFSKTMMENMAFGGLKC